jgi:hypothetical protein
MYVPPSRTNTHELRKQMPPPAPAQRTNTQSRPAPITTASTHRIIPSESMTAPSSPTVHQRFVLTDPVAASYLQVGVLAIASYFPHHHIHRKPL